MDNSNNLDTTRPIRVITMLSWIFTLSLGIPYSVNNNTGFPAVGLVPMSFSACTAIFAVTGRQKRSAGSVLTLDIFCTMLLFAIFIPSIVVMAEADRYMTADQTVVGTLGAAPMMLNLSVFCTREREDLIRLANTEAGAATCGSSCAKESAGGLVSSLLRRSFVRIVMGA